MRFCPTCKTEPLPSGKPTCAECQIRASLTRPDNKKTTKVLQLQLERDILYRDSIKIKKCEKCGLGIVFFDKWKKKCATCYRSEKREKLKKACTNITHVKKWSNWEVHTNERGEKIHSRVLKLVKQ